MTRRRTVMIAAIALALLAVVYPLLERRPEQEEIARVPEPSQQLEPPPPPGKEESPPEKPPSDLAITRAEIRAIRAAAPRKEMIRKEVRENPHVTPPSLIEFAKTMGPPMEKALKDPDAAAVLIGELRACAANENVATSARALCVSNTERLAEAHPNLRDEADSIRRNAPDEVIRITDAARG